MAGTSRTQRGCKGLETGRRQRSLIRLAGQHEYKYQLRVRNPVRQCVKQVAAGEERKRAENKEGKSKSAKLEGQAERAALTLSTNRAHLCIARAYVQRLKHPRGDDDRLDHSVSMVPRPWRPVADTRAHWPRTCQGGRDRGRGPSDASVPFMSSVGARLPYKSPEEVGRMYAHHRLLPNLFLPQSDCNACIIGTNAHLFDGV
ncbi:hypothetical protein C8Q77DRAFT_526440 [Trametes polyzona]|nr:hypothetical protein C8Q77DRAFT_526440 [Trametes polyzona]